MLNTLNKSEVNVAILFCAAILSLTFPHGIPLFGSLVLFFVALKFISGRLKILLNTGFLLLVLAVLSYFLGIFYSQEIYNRNLSDIFNIAGYLLTWLLLSDLNKDQYPNLVRNITTYSTNLVFALSILSLFKFFLYLGGINLSFLYTGEMIYPAGTSLMTDYNMFSLAISFGCISSLFLMIKSAKSTTVFYYFLVFITSFSTIALSGSRRGWILLFLLLILLLLFFLKTIITSRKARLLFIKSALITTYFTVLFFIVGYITGVIRYVLESEEFHRFILRFQTLSQENLSESASDRTSRWEYALELFNYSHIKEKLFGSGFEYLPQFAMIFNTTFGEDYPHNPLLSSLLYGGITGLLILIVLIVYSFYKVFRHRVVLGNNLVFFYIISWMFVFISGNSIFSVDIFGIVLIIILSTPLKYTKNRRFN